MTQATTDTPVTPADPTCEDALSTLLDLLADELQATNRTIVARMQSPVELIPQIASHLVAAGGKRLRPLLTLAAAKLCGYHGPRHVRLAACVEFIHTATLLHDDVVDESDLRRGLASANALFGNKASVLVGDFLFSRAFELMVEDGNLRVLKILSHASSTIAEGEVLQLVLQNDLGTTEIQYLEMIEGKTAALFEAATQVGAIVAEQADEHEQALAAYGRNLGIAFQLIDDALDYAASQAKLGKTVGDDFREGKITLPVMLAYQAADETERAFWQRTIERQEQEEGDLETALALMAKHNVIAGTVEKARMYGDIAKHVLGGFPDGALRRAMIDVVDYTLRRAR